MTSGTSARDSPQVPQTTGDTQYNVRNAALRGASSAFSKPPIKPKPQVNTYTGGNNGALLAATKVGSPRPATPQGSASPLRRDWTGGSNAARPSPSPMQYQGKSNSSSTLGIPDDHLSDRTSSPSNIAAKLAAARYSPMKPAPPTSVPRIPSERDVNGQDILPPPGRVGQVLARIDSTTSTRQTLKRRDSNGSHSLLGVVRSPGLEDKPTDDTSIPPTTSLVKLFEQNRPITPPNPSALPLQSSQRAPPVKSPKPQRKIYLPPEPQDETILERTRSKTPPPVKPKPQLDRLVSVEILESESARNFANLRKDSLGLPPVRQKSSQLTSITTSVPRPQPPPKRGTRQSRPRSEDLPQPPPDVRQISSSMSTKSVEEPSSPASFKSAQEEQEEDQMQEKELMKSKPALPPPRRSTKAKAEPTQKQPTPKRALQAQPPRTPNKMASPIHAPEKFSRPASAFGSSPPPSDTIYHSTYQRESVKNISKHMTGESLSSAIVGAALASSRNASPKPPSNTTPTVPDRHHHHSPFHYNRSPSPIKATGKLRTTLRKEPSSSSSEDEGERYRKKGTRVMGMRRKHPNKHHEGNRKRWRDSITERERKRYEGLWAANKGLYLEKASRHSPDDDVANDVCNIVTREIWLRSRLTDDVLEEVWDLVDGRGVGRLRREEFVVGLWLIDQRLKGKKLPPKVSQSVWGSVRGVGGLKVKVSHR